MTGRVFLVLEGRVPQGGQAALEDFLTEARHYYESHDGNRVSLYWDANQPNRFRETVEYASEEAFEADDERTRSDPTMIGLLDRWRALLEGPPQVTVWRPHQF